MANTQKIQENKKGTSTSAQKNKQQVAGKSKTAVKTDSSNKGKGPAGENL